MPRFNRRKLVAAALAARQRACAPYSRFQVGAALLTKDGAIVTGANVESASYGLTCCAERVALFKALTEGRTHFVAIAIVAAWPGGPMPCGACRQLLLEYAPQAIVLTADSANPRQVTEMAMAELLPRPFVLLPPKNCS
ncbi:MAG: cytidine deaminase [Verrucomicrobiota bacterium]